MKRTKMLFGLPALGFVAALSCAESRAQEPLRDQTGAPAPGNVGQKGRKRGCGQQVATVTSSGLAARVLIAAAAPVTSSAASAPAGIARPLLDAAGRPAPGNTGRKSYVREERPQEAAEQAAAAAVAVAKEAARPVTAPSGEPACGNCQSKGDEPRSVRAARRSEETRRAAP